MTALTATRGFDYALPRDDDKVTVTDGETFEAMLRQVGSASTFAFDFETSGLQWFKHARGVGLALACFDGPRLKSWYVPYAHDTGQPQLAYETVAPAFKRLFANDALKVAHHFKFDDHIARRENWHLGGGRYCTEVAARLHDENRRSALKVRAATDLGDRRADTWEKHIAYQVQKLASYYAGNLSAYKEAFGYSQIPIELCGRYACYDVHYTLRLWNKYESEGLSRRFARVLPIEMRLSGILTDMEEFGLPIDIEYLEGLRTRCNSEMHRLECDIRAEFPQARHVNLTNDNDVRDMLLHAGLAWSKTSKNGQLCVDKEVLDELADQHRGIPPLARWRLINKVATTYTDSILTKLDAQGILHGEIRQMGTATGRMSSERPNLQNFPSDSETRKDLSVRRAFHMRGSGWVRLYFDYSQAELRVLAAYCRDPILLDSYAKGEDVHSRTSREVFGSDAKEFRRLAKCFHPDVEVLTRRGWVAVSTLQPNVEVLQAHPSANGHVDFTWSVPLQLTKRRAGPSGLLRLYNKGIDLRVTPDHRMLGWLRSSPWRVVSASKFHKVRYWANAGRLCGATPAMTRWFDDISLRLLIAVQADGSYSHGSAIRFGFTKKRKINRMARLLRGIPHVRHPRNKQGVVTFTLKGAVGQRFKEFLGPTKSLPWSLLGCEESQRRILVEEAQFWDSHKAAKWKCFVYCSTDQQSAEVLQALATTVGLKARLSVRQMSNPKHRTAYSVRVSDHATTRGGALKSEKLCYDGEVFCLTTETSFVLVRDGGVPVVSGQCVNFGLPYGMSAKGFARQAHIPEPQAVAYLDQFMKRYRGVPEFRQRFWSQLRQDGGTFYNLWGRSRTIEGIDDKNDYRRGKAEREAFASLIQGTAAELTKESLVRIANVLKAEGIPAKLVNVIHDEVQIDVPADYLGVTARRVHEAMQDYPDLAPVPVVVDGSYSITNWADKRPLPPL